MAGHWPAASDACRAARQKLQLLACVLDVLRQLWVYSARLICAAPGWRVGVAWPMSMQAILGETPAASG